jgi:F-type H+-transporting ATPase subunit alpha
MNSEKADFMADVNQSGAFNDEIKAGFKAGLEQFKATQTW